MTPRAKTSKTAKPKDELAPKTKRNIVQSLRGDVEITPENALQISDVLTCVKIISETVASMPLTLRRRAENKVEIVEDHPLSKLLRRKPNPYTTAYQFKQDLLVDFLLSNYCVAVITRNKESGAINGLWQQRARDVSVDRPKDRDYELYYRINLEKVGAFDFHYSTILSVVNFNSNNGLLGDSIIKLSQPILKTANATTSYAKEFFYSGIAPDGFIEWTDTVSTDVAADTIAREELKSDLREKYSGAGKFHQAILLPKGAKWVQSSVDLQKAQAVETRKFNKQEISSLMRVVPFLMGENGGSGAEEQWQSFIKNLLPILANFENAFNTQLLTEEEQDAGLYFKFNADALERGNVASRFAAYATAANNGIMTINEIRRKEDLPPVEGGDELRQNSAIQSLDHSSNAGGTNENTQEQKDLQNGKV